jgi:hypothetical protein
MQRPSLFFAAEAAQGKQGRAGGVLYRIAKSVEKGKGKKKPPTYVCRGR